MSWYNPEPSSPGGGLGSWFSSLFGGPTSTYSPTQLQNYYGAQQAMMPGQQIQNPSNPFMNLAQTQAAAKAANADLAAGGSGVQPNLWDKIGQLASGTGGAGGQLQQGINKLAGAFTPNRPQIQPSPWPMQGQSPLPAGLLAGGVTAANPMLRPLGSAGAGSTSPNIGQYLMYANAYR